MTHSDRTASDASLPGGVGDSHITNTLGCGCVYIDVKYHMLPHQYDPPSFSRRICFDSRGFAIYEGGFSAALTPLTVTTRLSRAVCEPSIHLSLLRPLYSCVGVSELDILPAILTGILKV